MARIFVSYRHDDSPGHTGRLYDHLMAHFGSRTVFRDLEAIELGEDFKQAIEREEGSIDVLLAVIGPQWLDSRDKQGRRRLENPKDYVRLEIATALARGVRVIPVLVNDASMPSEEELPPDLAPLSFRNAIEISDTRFPSDVALLAHAIEVVLGRRPAPAKQAPPVQREPAPVPIKPAPPPPPPPTSTLPAGPPSPVGKGRQRSLTRFVLVGGAVLAVAVLLLVAGLRHSSEEEPLGQGGSGLPEPQDAGAAQPEDAGDLSGWVFPEAEEAGQPSKEAQAGSPLRMFDPGEGFTVLMPGSPEVIRQKIVIPAGDMPTAAWKSIFHGESYSIDMVDYPEKLVAAHPPEEFLEENKQALVNRFKGTLTSEKSISIYRVYPGQAFTVSSAKEEVRARSYLVGPRLYTLLVVYNPSFGAPYADAFLDSFRLINPPPPVPR